MNFPLFHSCWLPRLVFYVAFLFPLIVILIANSISFCMVIHQLRMVTLNKTITRTDTHQSTAAQLRGAVCVLVLLGLTWVFAFLAIGGANVAFSYLFIVCNTLQGSFIFVFYCLLKKEVQNAWTAMVVAPAKREDTSGKGE